MRFTLACFAAAALGASIAFAAPLQVTYELQHVENGEVYILDYDLTADDCRAALRDLPAGYAECAATLSNSTF